VTAERRHDTRYPVRPTEYIEIGDRNGGIILDISESGMAVATAQALVGNQTLKFRFQLPRQLESIEAVGEIHWIGETRKRAGVRFVDLPSGAREQILRWIALQTRNDISEDSGAARAGTGANGSGKSTATHGDFTERSQEFLNGMSPATQGRNGNAAEHSQVGANPPSAEEADSDDFEEEPIYEPQGRDDRAWRERRVQARRAPNASTYVEVDGGNAGLIGDLSASGLSLRAAKTLESDKIAVRFQVPGSQQFVDTQAWIVWKSASQKKAGARFDDLPDEARKHIAEWIGEKSSGDKTVVAPTAAHPKKVDVAIEPAAPGISLLAPDSVPIPAYISPITQNVIAAPAPPVATVAANSTAVPATIPTDNGKNSSRGAVIPVAPVFTPVVSRPAAKHGPTAPSLPKHVASVVPTATSAPVPVRAATSSTVPSHAAPARFDIPVPLAIEEPIGLGQKKGLSILPGKPSLVNPGAVLPAAYPESSWYLAPKKRFGFWKIAALVVVTAACVGAGNYFYRNRQASSASVEVAQPQSAGTPLAAATDTTMAKNSGTDNGSGAQVETAPAATIPTTPAVTTGPAKSEPSASSSAPGAGGNSVARETPKIKGDEQFVDEPRKPKFVDAPRVTAAQPHMLAPQRSQNSTAPAVGDNSNSSNTLAATSTQPAPRPTPTNTGVTGNTLSNNAANSAATRPANTTETSAPRNTSAPPAAATSVPPSSTASQNSSAVNTRAGATATSGGIAPATGSPPSSTGATTTPSVANTPVPAPATPTQNLVGTVSFFSRFRAIRGRGDILNGGPPNSGGMLQIGALAGSPVPAYPAEALRQQIQGLVELDVFVGTDGTVQSVHLVRGPAELAAVAMSAVRGWKYSPTVLGGKAVEAQQSVFFTFKLGK
jgi:TonB family protein